MVVIKAERKNGLYELLGETCVTQGNGGMSLLADKDNTFLWHRRLGRISLKGLQILSQKGSFERDHITKLEKCESCILGKQHKLSLKLDSHSSKNILEYVCADLWGPAQASTHGGKVYFLSVVADHSRKVWVYLLRHKSKIVDRFKAWKILVENQTNRKLKTLRTDNGLEFCSDEFNKYCELNGIQRHRTV